ncbi:GNAT family N-acetyltransferase [Thiobacillus sp.]|uniref:GNAT family N-acetyltransferase n=1 Tax=Thiobacillus sp. TaxID=924 RepID=UPI00179842FD|nr:GNAT family N-acetyltransferase [Thiobacillus sp.]MBC2731550.1 N-acetyltransferase [Thiobacillus sp.]MBC2740289.1 N-acetyltransferase [Thiobacillus sp.]MBC2759303.1 N-acetyltransferase [Thiobacillus sp.]
MEARQNVHFEANPSDAEAVIRVVPRIAELSADAWNALAGDSPFLQHAFLHALEATGCVGPDIGWEPVHLALFRNGHLDAAMPLYVKHHSWGEFVFDWAWADAYRRHGLSYYPKLVCCVPFSPVPGPRLLAGNDADRTTLIQAALKLTRDLGFSSFHILFPTAPDHAALEATPLMHRNGFQFHWNNAGYADFDAFLAAMTHDKRKKIRQERKKLANLGVTFRWVDGAESTDADWDHFYRCYADTYARHRSEPHLNRAFFAELRATLPDNLVLIIADKDGEPVACSFCMKDGQRLYGRHWGTLEYLPGLHFETCYQQGIEYAIAHGLSVFEGGAQGEHKLARGLVPTATHSWHWLENAEFREAVDRFLERETDAIGHYMDELETPFRREPPAAAASKDTSSGR